MLLNPPGARCDPLTFLLAPFPFIPPRYSYTSPLLIFLFRSPREELKLDSDGNIIGLDDDDENEGGGGQEPPVDSDGELDFR